LGDCLDSHFDIGDEKHEINGTPARARFLVDIEMSTHDKPSYAERRLFPGFLILVIEKLQ
jgi:hypothetical protein